MGEHSQPLKVILADTIYRQELNARIKQRVPDAEFVIVSPDGGIQGQLEGAEIFFAWGMEGKIVEQVVQKANHLRWFHLLNAGVDSLMFPALRDSEIVLTNARGIFSIPIAESVLAVILYVAKNLRGNFENARRRHWERLPRQELHGAIAGILGLGAIGSEVARQLACLNVRVIGLKRYPERRAIALVETIYGPEQLEEFLNRCDWVIACAALTKETQNMLGEEEFRAMKPNAWFVNIARGELAEEDALLRALDEGWITGACLDAFAQEPLPPDSPFWNHSKVVMTPHNAGYSAQTLQRSLELAMDNFDRYLQSQPLLNVVNKQDGY